MRTLLHIVLASKWLQNMLSWPLKVFQHACVIFIKQHFMCDQHFVLRLFLASKF